MIAVTALRVAGGLLCVTAVTAVVVRIVAAPEARDALDLGFGELPHRWSAALDVLANNLRLLAGVLLASGLVRAVAAAPGLPARVVTSVCDVALATSALAHALLVGSALGAYGERLVIALVAYAPLELAAYSLALGLYVQARRGVPTIRDGLCVAAASSAGLTLAAVSETLV